jgi:Nucleoside-diphosphate-sugar epimerases
MGEFLLKILVTGAKGFIGKNLIAELGNRSDTEILEYDLDTESSLLDQYTKDCDFVFHLAGVNRPENPEDFIKGNCQFTAELLEALKKHHNASPVMISSSIQAVLENPYGLSKRREEELLFSYSNETGNHVLVYRFPNVFGKWCRPNYNSAVATFCHNIAHNLPIQVKDPSILMNYVYIDDVVEELILAMEGNVLHKEGKFYMIPEVYKVTLGETVGLLQSFHENRMTLNISNMENNFVKKLYSTYLTYLPADQFVYPLIMHEDERGSFTEIFRTQDRGQFSVNIARPGITKGNHWHHSKNEKFIVISGSGLIQLRRIDTEDLVEYKVSGEAMQVVEIPPGYTHNIINIGNTDLITLIWVNEVFHPEKPDTYYLKV